MHAVPPPTDPGARRSLRARLAAGPVARRLALIDLRVYRVMRQRFHSPGVARVAHAYSRAGEHAACWLALGGAGVILDRRRRGAWARAIGAVGATYVLNTGLKLVVRRHRPVLEDLPALISTPTKLSFPSAHASSSFAAARAYGRLLPAAPLYAAATAMAASRVYLGVHYPSDILVGAALGTVVAGR
jgi:membrane-associated phospholipid phosphatase